MPRGNGGIIGPVNTSFSGVWSLTEAQLRRSGGTWPNFYAALLSESATGTDVFSGADAADPYFEYTTLLLPGNGTNGAQNNTFLDGSTNNFTITRNGNTTQGTFSPFSQTGWGNYFNGTNAYLTLPYSTALQFTGDFTVEFWVYVVSKIASFPTIVNNYSTYTTNGGFAIFASHNGGTAGKYNVAFNGSFPVINSTTSIAYNTWQHIALVRSGTGSNNITLYVDGVANGTASSNATVTGTANNWWIGTGGDGVASGYLNGYVSNLRAVKGVAVYTGAFTPPTSPLATTQSAGTNISAITGTQTSLLTCQSNRFIDNSTNNFTITRNGDTRVVAFSPFNPTASWSAATNGGSGYFDGNADYLSVDSTAESALNLTGTFTLEFWFYRNATGDMYFFSKGGGVDGWNATNGIAYQAFIDTGTLYFQFYTGSIVAVNVTAPPILQWNHFAIGRDGTTLRGWLNGSSIGTTTSTPTPPTTRNVMRVAANTVNGKVLNGYMAGLRIVNGTDVYGVSNTTITVPTAPLTAIPNTSLLLNFTNAGIYDATSKNDLETVGNAQISTAISAKWGSGSMYFDGTGDYLNTLSTWAISGSEAYTLEAWIYPTTVSGDLCIYETRSSSGTGFVLFINSTGKLQVYDSTGLLQTASTTTLTANTWTYIAMVRSAGSSTNTYYVNGTSAGTFTLASFAAATNARIGARNDGVAAYNGYMQDFRITKGYARIITASPTAAFPTL
jgi:hypothetical protein